MLSNKGRARRVTKSSRCLPLNDSISSSTANRDALTIYARFQKHMNLLLHISQHGNAREQLFIAGWSTYILSVVGYGIEQQIRRSCMLFNEALANINLWENSTVCDMTVCGATYEKYIRGAGWWEDYKARGRVVGTWCQYTIYHGLAISLLFWYSFILIDLLFLWFPVKKYFCSTIGSPRNRCNPCHNAVNLYNILHPEMHTQFQRYW